MTARAPDEVLDHTTIGEILSLAVFKDHLVVATTRNLYEITAGALKHDGTRMPHTIKRMELKWTE